MVEDEGTPNETAGSDRSFGLDLVRAAAIVLVLLGHAVAFFLPETYEEFPFVYPAGAVGVDIFFALSGFLIGGILMRQAARESGRLAFAWKFLLRRWFRTVPNYMLFLAVNVILVGLALRPGTFDFRFALFLQTMHLEPRGLPLFFPESWSLAVEEWSYLLLPLLAIAMAARPRPSHVALAGVTMLAFGLTYRFAAAMAMPATASLAPNVYDVPLRIDSIAPGVLVAYWARRDPQGWLASAKPGFLLGIALIAVEWTAIVLLYVATTLHDETLGRVLLASVPSAGVWGASLCLAAAVKAKPWKSPWASLVRRTSLTSYSLYLSHLPLAYLFLAAHPVGLPNRFAIIVLWLTACFIVSSFVWSRFEKPVMGLRERFGRRPATLPGP